MRDLTGVLDAISERARQLAERTIAERAETALAAAKEACPVDTGRLRDSVTVEMSGLTASVGTSCGYAAYVEFGTSRMPARPFLEAGFQAAAAEGGA